jgi:hypothetical protein
VVRRNDHKRDDDPNTTSSGRNGRAGLSLLGTKQKAAIIALTERVLRTQKAQTLGSLRDGSGKDA